MFFSLETLAGLATIVGTIISAVGVIQSRALLALVSAALALGSIAAIWYARQQRLALEAASIIVEGHSIDSLNIANLRRRVNRTFAIQEAHHTVRIEGDDMEITWKYSGYCRASRESAMEFSIDSHNSTAFEDLRCVAYDLGHDPEMTHEIRPMLVGSEGISKKVSVPFLEPLKAQQPFSLLLKCTLPGCLKAGLSYYTSTLSFAQRRVRRCVVRLIFVGRAPAWVRVYDGTSQQQPTLEKTLALSSRDPNGFEYVDDVEDRQGQSARVYMFWRDSE